MWLREAAGSARDLPGGLAGLHETGPNRVLCGSILRLEFKRFVNTIIVMPCQLVKSGRRPVYRLLSWNGWHGVFLRVVHALRC